LRYLKAAATLLIVLLLLYLAIIALAGMVAGIAAALL